MAFQCTLRLEEKQAAGGMYAQTYEANKWMTLARFLRSPCASDKHSHFWLALLLNDRLLFASASCVTPAASPGL